jgi:predicted PurR-regulated permease PerM
LVEGETITPLLLARRFTLNPVLVILSLVFWFLMWGIPGAILSVPMLAITKIVWIECDRLPLLAIFSRVEDRVFAVGFSRSILDSASSPVVGS